MILLLLFVNPLSALISLAVPELRVNQRGSHVFVPQPVLYLDKSASLAIRCVPQACFSACMWHSSPGMPAWRHTFTLLRRSISVPSRVRNSWPGSSARSATQATRAFCSCRRKRVFTRKCTLQVLGVSPLCSAASGRKWVRPCSLTWTSATACLKKRPARRPK